MLLFRPVSNTLLLEAQKCDSGVRGFFCEAKTSNESAKVTVYRVSVTVSYTHLDVYKRQVCEHIEVCGHPITDGLEDFTLVDETYIIGEPQEEGNTILITTNNPVSIKNIAWVRQYEKSRVFCYASGHDGQSYKDVSFRKVLKNGILWSIHRLH